MYVWKEGRNKGGRERGREGREGVSEVVRERWSSAYVKLAAESSTSPQEPIDFEPSVGHTQCCQHRDGHL